MRPRIWSENSGSSSTNWLLCELLCSYFFFFFWALRTRASVFTSRLWRKRTSLATPDLSFVYTNVFAIHSTAMSESQKCGDFQNPIRFELSRSVNDCPISKKWDGQLYLKFYMQQDTLYIFEWYQGHFFFLYLVRPLSLCKAPNQRLPGVLSKTSIRSRKLSTLTIIR
jgi:hypothetical protein